jgi:hypothetical protein
MYGKRSMATEAYRSSLEAECARLVVESCCLVAGWSAFARREIRKWDAPGGMKRDARRLAYLLASADPSDRFPSRSVTRAHALCAMRWVETQARRSIWA